MSFCLLSRNCQINPKCCITYISSSIPPKPKYTSSRKRGGGRRKFLDCEPNVIPINELQPIVLREFHGKNQIEHNGFLYTNALNKRRVAAKTGIKALLAHRKLGLFHNHQVVKKQ